jgi:hypothetical protein
MSTPILYLGLDVHKDSVAVAVFGSTGSEPLHLEKLFYDLHRSAGSSNGQARMGSRFARATRLAGPAT